MQALHEVNILVAYRVVGDPEHLCVASASVELWCLEAMRRKEDHTTTLRERVSFGSFEELTTNPLAAERLGDP